MKQIKKIVTAVAVIGMTLITQSAWAHATPEKSTPAAGETVAVAPKVIAITFNERVEPAFSAITVKDHSDKAVTTDKAVVDAADPATLKLSLPALSSGMYHVHWKAVGPDGHVRKGDYAFTVR